MTRRPRFGGEASRPYPGAMPAAADVLARLGAHLAGQLGEWPPASPLVLTTSDARTTPGWDGVVRTFYGVSTPEGAVVSLPPDALEQARRVTRSAGNLDEARYALEAMLGGRVGEAVFRWSEAPVRLPPLGEWLPVTHPALPEWLHPFGGDALVVRDDDGGYLAGVGIKRHDAHGWEIAVGTEEHARGRGLARRLVTTAAAHIIDAGKVPLYFHALDNTASAHVADAAGFPDVGWRLLFLLPADSGD